MIFASRIPRLQNYCQEVRELGLRRTLFRLNWEITSRFHFARSRPSSVDEIRLAIEKRAGENQPVLRRLLWGDPAAVRFAMKSRIGVTERARLQGLADDAVRGRILCFSRWSAAFGDPIDWLLNPITGRRWPSNLKWAQVAKYEPAIGDIKLTWEVGRFPHAYHLARAAALSEELRPELCQAFQAQLEQFLAKNPRGGLHWFSSQEIVFRNMALVFAWEVFTALGYAGGERRLALAVYESALHIAQGLQYARHAVYNNHLLSESLGLLLSGTLIPYCPEASHWSTQGKDLLTEQADVQFYPDGGYIQQSHNYHRLALQVYLWALVVLQSRGEQAPDPWVAAIDRSLGFLLDHQNPSDGTLPNYGNNDGGLPSLLSVCRYADFRSTLQAAAVRVRGERIFEPGPWDEEAAWFWGPQCLEAPLRLWKRKSVSFGYSGHHVLRGVDDGSFCSFRCGDVRDRFSQIDMLHVDVWWQGLNVLVDGGSYLYNGPVQWQEHFLRTQSHNTVAIDGTDQMVHFRRFKCLYWTKARLLRFEDRPAWALAEGEHYGYLREAGAIHQRSVLFVKDDLWIVADCIKASAGEHEVRLHWLAGRFPFRLNGNQLMLETPKGPFTVSVFCSDQMAMESDAVAGQESPPRGWLSRHYGEKIPVPSFSCSVRSVEPVHFLSVLCPGPPDIRRDGDVWSVSASHASARFRMADGRIELHTGGNSREERPS